MSVVEVTVVDQKGKCAVGHKVGDKIVFDGKSVKGDICYSALTVLLPKVYAMRYGAEFPWAKDKDVLQVPKAVTWLPEVTLSVNRFMPEY